MAVERRSLKMHPALLWSVIERQAGTIAKAILEGGMNSVDAGATFCDIKIDDKSFSIIDDGKGFRDETEIENFFETFGFPHKEGDATYGQFRMGRGQMFSFGRNVWRTGLFQMTVDMKPQKDIEGNDYALGYEFEKFDESVVGCQINVDLYDELLPSTLDKTIREIKKYLRYVDIPITLNGERISVDPASEKWDEVTDDAYIKRKTSGNLEVYNLGVLVKDSPSYYNGVSGVVVSRKQLKVNFARNDIQSDCPIWKRVNRLLQDQTLERAQKATPLTDAERGFYAQQIASGEVGMGVLRDTRVLTDVTGSHHPLKKLESVIAISIAPIGDRVAEMAHTRKMAFVLSSECAERFGVSTPEEFVALIERLAAKDHGLRYIAKRLTPIARAEFNRTISSHHEPMKDNELNKAEMIALRAIREGARALHTTGRYADIQGIRRGETFFDTVSQRENRPRRISVGVSDTADAWTNGTTDIWLNRKILAKMKRGLAGYMQVSSLLLHEYIHRGPSTGTHDHGVDFYEAFHNYSLDTDVLQSSSAAMMKSMLKQLRAEGSLVTNILSSLEDDVARGTKLGLDDFDEITPEVSEDCLNPDVAEEPATEVDQPTALAARSSEVPKKARRPKASEDRQFMLKF